MKKKILILGFMSIVLWATTSSKIAKNSVNCHASPFSYSYKYIESNIGDKIIIGGIDNTIVAIPFVEHSTGDSYYIQFPQRDNDLDWIEINVDYEVSDVSCYPDIFSTFPVSYGNLSYKTYYSRANRYISTELAEEGDKLRGTSFTISQKVDLDVRVKINKSIVNISSFYTFERVQRNFILDEDLDLTDNIDWLKVGVNTLLVDNLKQLLNHIKIVKVEK